MHFLLQAFLSSLADGKVVDLTLAGSGKRGARALLGGAMRAAAGKETVKLFGKQQLRYVRVWRVLEQVHQNLSEGRTVTQVRGRSREEEGSSLWHSFQSTPLPAAVVRSASSTTASQTAPQFASRPRCVSFLSLLAECSTPPVPHGCVSFALPPQADAAIQDVVRLLEAPRGSLGIQCSSRGLIAGSLQIKARPPARRRRFPFPTPTYHC